MVKKLSIIIALTILFGCRKELYQLSMSRVPYTGNELKINGYYYSNLTSSNDIGLAMFYRNGVCMFMYTRIESQDTLSYIENEILLNDELMSECWSTPNHIGVFRINAGLIEFETWEAGRDIITFSSSGVILSDTSFLLTEQVNNESGSSSSLNLKFRYNEFSPKPDSTNNFID